MRVEPSADALPRPLVRAPVRRAAPGVEAWARLLGHDAVRQRVAQHVDEGGARRAEDGPEQRRPVERQDVLRDEVLRGVAAAAPEGRPVAREIPARGAEVLVPGGALILYGPFMEGGRHNAESNAQFDESLRSRDPSWGIRDLNEVMAIAANHDLVFDTKTAMPANNFTVVFQRAFSTR